MTWISKVAPWIEKSRDLKERQKLIDDIIKVANKINLKLGWKEPEFTKKILLETFQTEFPGEEIHSLEQVEAEYYQSFLLSLQERLSKLEQVYVWGKVKDLIEKAEIN